MSAGNKISITFYASTGSKVTLEMEASTTIEDLVKEYAKKIDLPEDYLGKEVMFLYNGAQLDYKSQSPIGSMFRNFASITAYDLFGIIGFWTINFDASTGKKISMKIDQSKTIKDMMEAYTEKIGVSKEAIGKEIVFLFNGGNLDYKKNDIVERVLRNKSSITVFER